MMAKVLLSRRMMIFGSLLSGGLFLTGGILLMSANLENVIRRRLGYLKIPDDVINQFANDFYSTRTAEATLLQRLTSNPGRVAESVFSGNDVLALALLAEERVCTLFLFSTDFFQNGADVSKPLQYLYFADPYVSPCVNPIAEF